MDDSKSELVKLVKHAIARTDLTIRLCVILAFTAPAAALALYTAFVLLPEVMRR